MGGWSRELDRGTLTNANDVELEAALQQLALNLRCDAVETDMALGVDGRGRHRRHFFSAIGWSDCNTSLCPKSNRMPRWLRDGRAGWQMEGADDEMGWRELSPRGCGSAGELSKGGFCLHLPAGSFCDSNNNFHPRGGHCAGWGKGGEREKWVARDCAGGTAAPGTAPDQARACSGSPEIRWPVQPLSKSDHASARSHTKTPGPQRREACCHFFSGRRSRIGNTTRLGTGLRPLPGETTTRGHAAGVS